MQHTIDQKNTEDQNENVDRFLVALQKLVDYINAGGSVDMAIRILGALVKRYVISTRLAKDAFKRLCAAAESLWICNGFYFDVDEARTKDRDVQIARELQLTRGEAKELGLQVTRLGSELGPH